MPIYLYRALDKKNSCKYCIQTFEYFHRGGDDRLKKCPRCGAKIEKVFTSFSMGFSKTNFDRKAKEKGFHKLKKVDKGKYEKLY